MKKALDDWGIAHKCAVGNAAIDNFLWINGRQVLGRLVSLPSNSFLQATAKAKVECGDCVMVNNLGGSWLSNA